MAYKGYHQIPQERFEIVTGRYRKYLEVLNDPNVPPVKVFDPLPAKQIQELQLIREVSKDLQKKKEEDMKKAVQAKKEEEEKAAAEKAAAEAAALEESKKEE